MRTTQCVFWVLMLTCLLTDTASAGRLEPDEVTPIKKDGIIYTAPTSKMGYLVATDEKTDKELWRVQIYKITYKPRMEKDVQDVYIKEIRFDGNKILITTEKKKRFELDLATRSDRCYKERIALGYFVSWVGSDVGRVRGMTVGGARGEYIYYYCADVADGGR